MARLKSANTLEQRIAAACAGEPEWRVGPALIAAIGELVGQYPAQMRNFALNAVVAQLRDYVASIPPDPDADHAA